MSETRFTLPSEWHPQRCIQLTWPHEHTDWAPYLDEITKTMTLIANAITMYEDLLIASQNPRQTMECLSKVLSAQQMTRVTAVQCATNDTWARDHGGITLIDAEAAENASPAARQQILDFRFNGWGDKFDAYHDNNITRRLHEAGALKGEIIDFNDFILEGGSIESDGRGTLFTTSQCLLAPHRNQPMDRNDIERELKRRLKVSRVVWLNHGTLIGDDTDGHIDTTVRICPDNTILYVKSTDESDPQHGDFEALEQELQQLRTADGSPYRLLSLPMPRPCHYEGERLPATYANFLVINGAVLVPTYSQPDLDSKALQTIAEAFPGRRMIAIDSQVIIRQHGSIHCLTMQYPY